MQNGIDDMEIVMELNEEHLGNMKIPLGHRIKIMKQIKVTKPTKSGMGGVPVTHHEYEELEPPPGVKTELKGGSLLEGTYDEEANARAFQDAVQEFREKGKENLPEAKRTVRFADEEPPQ